MHLAPRRSRSMPAFCLLTIIAAACADTTAASSPDPGPGGRAIPLPPQAALPILSSSQARGLLSVPWDLGEVQQGGRRIVVSVSGGSCVGLPVGVRVAQTSASVTIAALARPPKDKGGFCTQQRISKVTSVKLPDPLGSRRLRHALVDEGQP
jgi:hypothetical protein